MPQNDKTSDRGTDHEAQAGRTGQTVRALRERQGLSVRTLAKTSGFSPSFISQVEHGAASPSIASMEKIAQALGVSLSEFFSTPREDTAPVSIVRAGEGQELTSEWSQATLRSLGHSRGLLPVLLALEPGGRSGSKPVGHSYEEFAYVVSGSVQMQLRDGTRALASGDAVLLPPETEHRWENTSSEQAQILLVSIRNPGLIADES